MNEQEGNENNINHIKFMKDSVCLPSQVYKSPCETDDKSIKKMKNYAKKMEENKITEI
jgi:hypothetical protein